MKVCIRKSETNINPDQLSVISDFVKFLQSQVPLSSDVEIVLTDDKEKTGTTGIRRPKSHILVLAKNRMLVDILRTLSHEWIHEFQHQKMGLEDDAKIQDIGGPEENMCNVLSGIIIKKFDKQNPELKDILYESEEKKEISFIQDEMDEIERAVQDLSRDEGIDITVGEVVDAFENGKEIKIPIEVWARLENTESNQIKKGELDKVKELARRYNKTNPSKLAKILKTGNYNRPMILKFGDRFHLVAGNTRLSTAAALGMTPIVLIGEIK